jgi:cellulose synthase operon protein C
LAIQSTESEKLVLNPLHLETADSSFSILTFWRRWPAAIRPLLAVAAFTFLTALGLSVAAYLRADDIVRPWQPLTDLQPLEVAVDSVRVGTLAMPVLEPGFIATQLLAPAAPIVNLSAAAWLLALLTTALIGYLTILPGLGWRSFLVGAGAATFFLSTLNLDLLGLFPPLAPAGSWLNQGALLVSVLVLISPAWTLHAFFPSVGPTRRLVLFGALVLGLGALVFWRSPLDVPRTAMHLASYGMAGALGAVVALVLWVSYENVRAILWLTGQADSPARRRGIGAFALATGLYLLNLLLLFLDAFGFVTLGGAFLDAFFVLLSSIISGLFGLRLRETEYGRAISYLLMLPLYLLLAALTLGTLGYGFATANGPLLEAFTDGIVLTHLVGGAAFFIYLMYNFTPLIQKRMRTYRVVFEPKRLPLLMLYAVMGIGILSVLMRQQFFLNRLFMAAYYDGLGDLYRTSNADELAAATYQRADAYVPFDEKANTSRAALAHAHDELQLEQNLLRRALRRTPSEKTYAALSASYRTSETAFFEQQRILTEARRTFPESPVPALLLATLYSRTALTDSVKFYFAKAARSATFAVRGPLLTNELAWLLSQRDDTNATDLARQVSYADPLAAQANAALIALATGRRLNVAPPIGAITDSLTAESFAWVTHRALRLMQIGDTSLLPALQYLASRPVNTVWAPDLLEIRALGLRAGGRAASARSALLERAEGGEGEVAGRRYRILGLWALADQQPAQAVEWLARAANRGDQAAYLYRVVALARAGQLDSARQAIPVLFTSGDPALTRVARRLQIILTSSAAAMTNDSLRTDFVLLRAASERPSLLDSVTTQIRRPAERALAVVELADRALTAGEASRAYRLTGLAPQAAAVRWVRAEAALRTGRLAEAAKLLQPAPPVTDNRSTAWHLYLTGALAAARNDVKAATAAFAALPGRAPWLERGTLAAAEFFTHHPPRANSLAAYNALLAGVRYNPQSAALWQAYAFACIRAGLMEFAADARDQAVRLLPATDAVTFNAQFDAAVREARRASGFE